MKKIITAIGNEILNNNLKKEINVQVIMNDIQYKEGVIEVLEQNSEVDIIILNNLLQGEISTKELINKINLINSKIKIIVILEKFNEDMEKYLYSKNVFKVIYNNQLEIKDLIKIINNKNESNEELKEEIKNLKNIILENQNIKNKNKLIKKFVNKYLSKIKFDKKDNKKVYIKKNSENRNAKIISVNGPNGVGKSIIVVNLAKINVYSKNKILIIDLDIQTNSIHTILGINKYPIKNNIQEEIIKINKKIDLINGKDVLLNCSNKININKINHLKNKYDLIIIDLYSNISSELLENVVNLSNINLFISDTNLLEISKSIKLLDTYINKYKINKNKFNILFNKYNLESIDIKLLNKIFGEFNVIGYLKYNKKYNDLINKNSKNFINNKRIRNEYLKINNLINKKLI